MTLRTDLPKSKETLLIDSQSTKEEILYHLRNKIQISLCSSNPIQQVKIELNVKTTTLHKTRAQTSLKIIIHIMPICVLSNENSPSFCRDIHALCTKESKKRRKINHTILGGSPAQLQTARGQRVLMQSTSGAC